jgi:hypothetical protein
MKWLNRRKEKSYKELWLMVYGFEEYSSGLIYRHQKAQERIEALDTTNEVLNRRILKLEKDIVKLAEAQTERQ